MSEFLKGVRDVLAVTAAIMWIVLLLAILLPSDRDDTDPPHGRSGIKPYTDHATGCQYLARPFGGLTPRLDRNGKHMCGPEKP